MGSKVWTAGNLYVNQSGKIVQLMAVARQEGSAQELAIYQEMHAPFTVWAKSLSAFGATYHKMAEVLEEKHAPQERVVEASGEKRAGGSDGAGGGIRGEACTSGESGRSIRGKKCFAGECV